MIGAVTHKGQAFRFSTRAMMALEAASNKGIAELVNDMQTDPSITRIVSMVAAIMNDGTGADTDAAMAFVDREGFEVVSDIVARAVAAAFPSADGEGETPNVQGAGQAG